MLSWVFGVFFSRKFRTFNLPVTFMIVASGLTCSMLNISSAPLMWLSFGVASQDKTWITDLVMRVRSVGGRSMSFFRPAQFVSLGSFWAKTSHHCSRIRSRVFSVRLTLPSILNAHICPLKNNNSKNMKNNKQWINLTFPLSSYNFSSDSCCQLSIANCHFLSLPMWNTSSSVLAQRWPWHVFCSRENLRTLAVWWM